MHIDFIELLFILANNPNIKHRAIITLWPIHKIMYSMEKHSCYDGMWDRQKNYIQYESYPL